MTVFSQLSLTICDDVCELLFSYMSECKYFHVTSCIFHVLFLYTNFSTSTEPDIFNHLFWKSWFYTQTFKLNLHHTAAQPVNYKFEMPWIRLDAAHPPTPGCQFMVRPSVASSWLKYPIGLAFLLMHKPCFLERTHFTPGCFPAFNTQIMRIYVHLTKQSMSFTLL